MGKVTELPTLHISDPIFWEQPIRHTPCPRPELETAPEELTAKEIALVAMCERLDGGKYTVAQIRIALGQAMDIGEITPRDLAAWWREACRREAEGGPIVD